MQLAVSLFVQSCCAFMQISIDCCRFLETSFDHMQVRRRPNWKALRHRFQGANDVVTVTNKSLWSSLLQTVMTSFACNTHDDAQVHEHDLLSSAR